MDSNDQSPVTATPTPQPEPPVQPLPETPVAQADPLGVQSPPPVVPEPINQHDSVTSQPPEHPPHAKGGNPAVILGIILLLVLGAAAGGFYWLKQQTPVQQPVQQQQTLPTVPPTEVPTPTASTEGQLELENRAIPQTGAEIGEEIELLDRSVNDGSEKNFEETSLQGIEE